MTPKTSKSSTRPTITADDGFRSGKSTNTSRVKDAPLLQSPFGYAGHQRIIIEHVTPEVDAGRFPIKRALGEAVAVKARIFAEGHDKIHAVLLYKQRHVAEWNRKPLHFEGNDLWSGAFTIDYLEPYEYTIEAWVNAFETWRQDFRKKYDADQPVDVEAQIAVALIREAQERCRDAERDVLEDMCRQIQAAGQREKVAGLCLDEKLAEIMTAHPDEKHMARYERTLTVRVDDPKALFSAWYEFFPRSWAAQPGDHGSFRDCVHLLPEIARMGFNVIYLPPIHPIGRTNRKGKNNAIQCEPVDPGSPWAIGGKEGGHKAIHPALGTLADFKEFIAKAKAHGIDIAMDLALQCSMDHPYIQSHPQWFKWRPDGKIQYAENPPKKYQDIVPINFETEDWQNLWQELKSIVVHWIEQGVRIFRVDNPHTKPFVFWDWLIHEIKSAYPDTIFLSEAFTRPYVMYRLAKGGFDQSYTYFTWRHTKQEFIDYLTELTRTEVAEYCRPNFWPNTPDILPEHLQYGGRPVFIQRLVLAATLSSNYGIYGPAFELCANEAVPGKEEYLNSEKYEIKKWNWHQEWNLKDLIARVNTIRRENPALQATRNLRFCSIDNDFLLAYYKASADLSNVVLIVVNLDAHHVQSGWVQLPLAELDIPTDKPFLAHDLLTNDRFVWQGGRQYIELNPQISPAHIFHLRRKLRREQDFDYFM